MVKMTGLYVGKQMNQEKAKNIINELLKNGHAYEQASIKEGEVWGKTFSNDDRNEALKKDQEAAQALQLNRDALSLPIALRKHNLKPEIGLSLACGGGRAERDLLQKRICRRFHGIDVAENALREARQSAKNEHLDITYEQADINSVSLESSKYDLVVTQNCLHHVLKLEYLADEIKASLKPGGTLWIQDYIGETQFQYDEERLQLVNQIKNLLPDHFNQDLLNMRTINQLVRKKPGTLISPFEAIRSEEIIPIFLERFDVIDKSESSSFLDLVCPPGTRGHYTEDSQSKAIFELMFLFDRLLIEKNVFKPRIGHYLLKPKPE